MKLDRAFTRSLITLATPLIIQEFIYASLNMVDVVMIGQLGETAIAGVGLANQVFFLLMFMLFGISSGAGIFSAQYWGKGDLPGIHKVLGIALSLSLAASTIFTIIALGFPKFALSIYTSDPAVIEQGSSYLWVSGFSYLLTAISFSYGFTLRSTGNVRLPMLASGIAISLKTLLSYLLIFGHLGLPAMGLTGAALATIIARAVECVVLIGIIYLRRLPVAASLGQMFSFDRIYLFKFLKTSLPVVANETLWSLGVTTYNLVYARISTDAISAVNIASTFEGLAFVAFIGVSDACGILIGNKIGAGDEGAAYRYARYGLIIGVCGAVLVGAGMIASTVFLPHLYHISPSVLEYARLLLMVMGSCLWVRVLTLTLMVGVLRSGGDTRYALILDAGVMWTIGVPTAFITAFVFHLPVYWVYLLIISEELIKSLVALARFRSKHWIHNLAGGAETAWVPIQE